MSQSLNSAAFDHAKNLIAQGKYVADPRGDWSHDKPSAATEDNFIAAHGWPAYGNWYLGLNSAEHDGIKARYSFPFGDFDRVHRSALLAAESRAGQYKYPDIENAAKELREMIDAKG